MWDTIIVGGLAKRRESWFGSLRFTIIQPHQLVPFSAAATSMLLNQHVEWDVMVHGHTKAAYYMQAERLGQSNELLARYSQIRCCADDFISKRHSHQLASSWILGGVCVHFSFHDWLDFCPIHMGFPLDSNVHWKSHLHGHLYSAFGRRLVSKSAETSYRLPKKPPERRSAPVSVQFSLTLWQMILHYGNGYILLPSWWCVHLPLAVRPTLFNPLH